MKYHDAVINFWDILTNHHVYANGSSSGPRPNVTTQTSLSAEHWGVPDHLCNTLTKEIAESCVSHNTQKLTSSIFTWTADAKYANSYMNMFYNAVLPTQSKSNGSYVYHLPLGSPRNKKYLKDNDFFCCSGSCAEAFSQLNTGIYYHNDSAIWVNLYVPSEVNWKEKNVKLKQDGNFPKDTVVNFTVSTKRKAHFALKLLIPSWAKGVDLYINNEKQSINSVPVSFLVVRRNWRDKDEIRLVFHYDFHLKPMPDNPQTFAIFYGPMMLAFESNDEIILKGDTGTILNNLSVLDSDDAIFQLKNDRKKFLLRPLFDIDKQSYGVYASIRNY